MTQPTNQSDRDLLIRVDADVKHLTTRVKEVSQAQVDHAARTQELASSLQTLTYNVGALVEGMKEAKAGLDVQNQLVNDVDQLKAWRADFNRTYKDGIDEIKAIMEEDRQQWKPWVALAGHWKWMVAGAVAVVGFVGWPTIKSVLALIASV
jgi:DNA repair ATPase RecN